MLDNNPTIKRFYEQLNGGTQGRSVYTIGPNFLLPPMHDEQTGWIEGDLNAATFPREMLTDMKDKGYVIV